MLKRARRSNERELARTEIALVLSAVLSAVFTLWAPAAKAESIVAAVATNFSETARVLVEDFESSTAHDVRLVFGSTGKLYAQIVNGAPYDLFLAADRARPQRLVRDGRAVASSLKTYARGRLVLWSRDAGLLESGGRRILQASDFRRLAVAHPDLAPYGRAATEVLESLGLAARLQPKIVRGENVGQAFTLVATGNAELGFLAGSQVLVGRHADRGSRWIVPTSLYEPIRQDLIVLNRAAENPAAIAFARFLDSDPARRLIANAGYQETTR